MKITTVGIDLAKAVLQVHGVDEHGKATVSSINEPIQRRERLGGMLNFYYREAA